MIIITGQTATGKTQLALEYAKKLNGELVNFDSRQIYQYLDIITGKDILPTTNHQSPIWLYDIVKPNQYFSSFDYRNLAYKVIEDIVARGKTPILVGGTYLYLYHLLYQIDTENIPPDFELRKKLNKTTVTDLQEKLKSISVQSINRLNKSDKNNPQRLIRKIEIARHYQKINQEIPMEFEFKINNFFEKNKLEIIGLKHKNREELVQKITERVNKRIKQGAIEEVKKILKLGFNSNDPGLKTIGYQQVIKFLDNDYDEKTMINEWINKEVQYAKRQLTFMKRDKNITWKE